MNRILSKTMDFWNRDLIYDILIRDFQDVCVFRATDESKVYCGRYYVVWFEPVKYQYLYLDLTWRPFNSSCWTKWTYPSVEEAVEYLALERLSSVGK